MNSSGKVLLDTDIVSLYFRKSPTVVPHAQNYLADHSVFSFSIITRFEILRGIKVRNAVIQVPAFELFCRQNEIIDLTDRIVNRAADIYADLYKLGKIIGDADILIAATAMENNIPLVTNNERHFNRISGIQILNWSRM
jgi:tRNA(fMet)-specific endonuclease VapC